MFAAIACGLLKGKSQLNQDKISLDIKHNTKTKMD